MPSSAAEVHFPTSTAPLARVQWNSIVFYYVVACAISWPIFFVRNHYPEIWNAWNAPSILKSWLPAFGPLIGSLAARWLFRLTHSARISLAGNRGIYSLAFAVIFVLALTVVGVKSTAPHLDGLIYSGAFLVYAFCEESGWRGFLQDALHPLAEFPRYVVLGLLWGAWHFTTFFAGPPRQAIVRVILMAVLWIAGSWGIGKAVESTRSLTVAIVFHLCFNLFRSLPFSTVRPVLAICIPVWVLLLWTWKMRTNAGQPRTFSAGE